MTNQGRLALHRFNGTLRKVTLLLRHLGWGGALRYVGRRANLWLRGQPHRPAPKNDVIGFYDYLIRPATPRPAAADIAPRTMNWLIPHFEVGSGGHMTVFRTVQQLERRGYRCHLVLTGLTPTNYRSGAQVRRVIRKHFLPLQAEVSLGEASLRPAEFTVATSWDTAYAVRRFGATRHKIYFIQDREPDFYAHGSSHAFAEATYRFGFTAVTAGDWLARMAREEYGMTAYPFGFSYDKQHHRPPPATATASKPGPQKVFFYARSVTPRRGFELGLLTLELVHRALPEVEFVLAGWDTAAYAIPFRHVDAGVVAPAELPNYYRQCEAALVLSLTNLSLLPLELMACGCPVVSNAGPNVEWQLKHNENALLAPPTPEDLAAALIKVLTDAGLRRRLIDNGLRFAQATDWDRETAKVYTALEQIRSAARAVQC